MRIDTLQSRIGNSQLCHIQHQEYISLIQRVQTSYNHQWQFQGFFPPYQNVQSHNDVYLLFRDYSEGADSYLGTIQRVQTAIITSGSFRGSFLPISLCSLTMCIQGLFLTLTLLTNSWYVEVLEAICLTTITFSCRLAGCHQRQATAGVHVVTVVWLRSAINYIKYTTYTL